jgi:DHA1 family multidrug resistance protein-like MFS transporter
MWRSAHAGRSTCSHKCAIRYDTGGTKARSIASTQPQGLVCLPTSDGLLRASMNSALRTAGRWLSQLAPPWFFAVIPYRLGVGLTSTLMPLFVVQVVGGTVVDVGLVTALGPLVGVPASVFWGNLSDRLHRRRPFLFLGFFGFAGSTILLGLAGSVAQVALISMTGALLSTAVEPVASALVMEGLPEERWAESFGRFSQIGGWSFVAGLGVGMAWLALVPRCWGTAMAMRGLFVLAGATALLSLALLLRFLPERTAARRRLSFRPAMVGRLVVAVVEQALHHPSRLRYHMPRPALLADLRHYLRNALGRYYLATILLFFSSALGLVPFPIFLTDVLGASSTQVFFVFLVKAVTDALFYLPMGRLAQRRSGITLLAQASATRVAILGAFALIALLRPGLFGLIPVTLVHILTGVTWAAIAVSGTTVVAALAPKGLEGRAMGLYNSVIGLAWILGSLAGGWVAGTLGYTVSFSAAAGLMALMAIWFWRQRGITPGSRSR